MCLNKKFILFVLTQSLLFSNLAFSKKKNEKIIAVINGSVITEEVFERTYQQNKLYVSNKVVTKEKVLEDLINRELGIQRAKQLKLQTDPVVKTKMEDVLYHAQISKDLEAEFKKITVADQEISEYYKDHKEFRTAHILFRVRVKPTKEETDAALNQALKVYKQVKSNPEMFPELANKFSQSSVAPEGGDMGFNPAVRLAPEFFKAISGRGVGYVTPPVRTQFGYHVIKILGVKKFDEINKNFYKKVVYDQKRDALLGKYYTDLRSGASIKINKQYLQ